MIEIICSGIGGQGVLVAGMVLADIAMEDGKNVSWYPSYGFEMRGGAANCEVKIGDEDLQSPYCYELDILLTMSESAIDSFEERLKPGGVLLVNSSLVNPDRKYRDDIKVIKVRTASTVTTSRSSRFLQRTSPTSWITTAAPTSSCWEHWREHPTSTMWITSETA